MRANQWVWPHPLTMQVSHKNDAGALRGLRVCPDLPAGFPGVRGALLPRHPAPPLLQPLRRGGGGALLLPGDLEAGDEDHRTRTSRHPHRTGDPANSPEGLRGLFCQSTPQATPPPFPQGGGEGFTSKHPRCVVGTLWESIANVFAKTGFSQ